MAKAKKNLVAVDEVEERKEYLLQRFEDNTLTIEEMNEFLEIPSADLSIEQTARTQRIDPEIYKELMTLNPDDGRYVYYDKNRNEYEQSDDLLSENEIDRHERIIDLLHEKGLVIRYFGGLL